MASDAQDGTVCVIEWYPSIIAREELNNPSQKTEILNSVKFKDDDSRIVPVARLETMTVLV